MFLLKVEVEENAGVLSQFRNDDYAASGAKIVGQKDAFTRVRFSDFIKAFDSQLLELLENKICQWCKTVENVQIVPQITEIWTN